MREEPHQPQALLFIDGSWFINSKCFFFYLPHCQAPINIHEFPAWEYLSSQREGWVGQERGGGGARRTCRWGGWGLCICYLPSGLPFQTAAGRVWKALGWHRDLHMPVIILPQHLWKNTTHSGGREGVCAVFAAPTLALAWKLIALRPPAQERREAPHMCH